MNNAFHDTIVLSKQAAGTESTYLQIFVHKPTKRTQQSVHKKKRVNMGILDFLGLSGTKFGGSCIIGDNSIMSKKSHGTSSTPVQEHLKWGCDVKLADKICNFNRHYAEPSGSFTSTDFIRQAKLEYEKNGEIKFYDSNTGKLLFVAPNGERECQKEPSIIQPALMACLRFSSSGPL